MTHERSRSLWRVALPLALLTAVVATRCGGPKIQDGQIACGLGGLCPPGFVCHIDDGRCYADTGGENCGNGLIDSGETCDPCSPDCDDGNACTEDVGSGSSAACTLDCAHTAIAACIDGDDCCPAGCDDSTDDDCSASCGNGSLDEGETCDPPATCPISCDDGNACTADVITGSPGNCNVTCSHAVINACQTGDGCCPSSCTSITDGDCSAACGNGELDDGETCDPPGSCPTSCDDGNACTFDIITGSPGNCNVSCGHTSITTCQAGDGCCPPGCNSGNDGDCSAMCGNGFVDMGETCDPPASCPTSCSDGNACTFDTLTGSAANCNVMCGHSEITTCQGGDGCCPPGCNSGNDPNCSAMCGNGFLDPGETCDPPASCPTSCSDGNSCTIDTLTGSAANCNVACAHTTITTCQGGDGCCPAGCNSGNDPNCSAMCGNGFIDPGETCDPPSSCPASCDDGNACTQNVRTGNSANCNVFCSFPPITQCGADEGCCPVGCDKGSDPNCSSNCGNGSLDVGETCDPPSTCPMSCNDFDPCTNDVMFGSPANCNVSCSHSNITQCIGGDGCCPVGCGDGVGTGFAADDGGISGSDGGGMPGGDAGGGGGFDSDCGAVCVPANTCGNGCCEVTDCDDFGPICSIDCPGLC